MNKRFLALVVCSILFLHQAGSAQGLTKQDLALFAKENLQASPVKIMATGEKKSTGIALLLSAVMPGMGELYVGDYSTGKYFTAAEIALWVTALSMSSYSTWLEKNYKQYAKSKAGVQGDSFDSDYYANLANYNSLEEYNNEKAFNREYSSMYDVNSRYWKWNTVTERKSYRTLWVSSRQANNNIRFATGAMILNRIASMINAVRLVTTHNKSLQNTVSIDFQLEPITPVEAQLVCNCRVSF
jgi:TM2 domain-containing membrane protein YozV